MTLRELIDRLLAIPDIDKYEKFKICTDDNSDPERFIPREILIIEVWEGDKILFIN